MKAGAGMKLRMDCPGAPDCGAQIEWRWTPEREPALNCPRCDRAIQLQISESLRERNMIDACPACGSPELYSRKDFPQGFGLAVVVIAAVGSFYLLKSHWFLAWGLLLGALLIDGVLYRMVGFVTCCYRCKAEFRDTQLNSAHASFDLATAEKYP